MHDECAKCGRPRSVHDDLMLRCPTEHYSRYDPKYDGDGNIDADYKDVPVCPGCGARVEDEWYELFPRNETHARITCDECQTVYDCECEIEYHFTSTIPDLEAEKREEEERLARHEAWLCENDELAARFPPGTRVRDKRGREGQVANEERKSGGYVHVAYPDQRWTSYEDPRELEVIE